MQQIVDQRRPPRGGEPAQVVLAQPAGGMFVYSFSGGTVASLPGDLAAGIAGSPPPGLLPGAPVTGLVLGAAASEWLTVSAYFGGVP